MSAEFRIVIVDETGATFGRGSAAAMARPDISEMQQTAERAVKTVVAPETNVPSGPAASQAPSAGGQAPPSATTASGVPVATAPAPGAHQVPDSGANQPVPSGPTTQPSAGEPRERSAQSRQGGGHGAPAEEPQPTSLLGRIRSMLGGAATTGLSVAAGTVEAIHGGKEMITGAAEGNVGEVSKGFGTMLTAINHLMGMIGGQGHGGSARNLVQTGSSGNETAPATQASVKEAVATAMQAGAKTTPAMLDQSDTGDGERRRSMRDRLADMSYKAGKKIGSFAAKAYRKAGKIKSAVAHAGRSIRSRAFSFGKRTLGKKAMGGLARVAGSVMGKGGGMAGAAATAARALGVALGGLTAGVTLAVGAVAGITAAFNKLGSVLEANAEEWAGYSPEVSSAFGARAKQHEQHQMARADRFGERAANVIDFGTRWEKMMADYYDEFLDIMYTAWEWLQPWGEAVLWGLNMFIRWFKGKEEEEEHEPQDPFLLGLLGQGDLAFQLPSNWAGGKN